MSDMDNWDSDSVEVQRLATAADAYIAELKGSGEDLADPLADVIDVGLVRKIEPLVRLVERLTLRVGDLTARVEELERQMNEPEPSLGGAMIETEQP